jgi:anti-anti-sigma regulatory factor/HAMP domain-containing protein
VTRRDDNLDTFCKENAMFRTLKGQVTLASLFFGAMLVTVTALGLWSVLTSTRASSRLGTQVLARREATHRFQLGLTRAIGEAESYARSGGVEDRAEAQRALRDARAALTILTTLTAQDEAAGSPRDVAMTFNQRQLMLLERAERLLGKLTSGDAATQAEAVAAMEALHKPLDQLMADVMARDAQMTDVTLRTIAESNQGAVTSLGLAGSFLTLLLGLAVVLLRRRILRPLQTLEAATHALATQQFVNPLLITGRDELGRLQRAFNQMAATIRTQTHDLEQQVATAQDARAVAEDAQSIIRAQLVEMEDQCAAIRESSVSVLPVTSTTLVTPLVGVLNRERLALLERHVLENLQRVGARHLLLDMTNVPLVDSQVARGLLRVTRAARLLGVAAVLVGIRPEVAQTMLDLGINFGTITTSNSLESSIAYATQ